MKSIPTKQGNRLFLNPFLCYTPAMNWKLVFEDNGTDNWTNHWILDGYRSRIINTPEGMVFEAGAVPNDNGSHGVLWTKQKFHGDVKIEFDFTRLDSINRYVNILYIQASGREGMHPEDINTWREQRNIPSMASYYLGMNLLHISYAAFNNDDDKAEDYIRARRYPAVTGAQFADMQIPGEKVDTGCFHPGKTYHVSCEKTDISLSFKVDPIEGQAGHRQSEANGTSGGVKAVWDTSDLRPLQPGPIGIRHMATRCSRYKNIKIYQRES